ncbi:MAG: SMP-30/gluconolactonase/LRE family protein [Gaiellales bacterium]
MTGQAPVVGRGLRTLVDGLDHPEGVCWYPAAGAVYAGGEAGQLYCFGLDGGGHETVATVPGGFLLGLAVDGRGNVYACDTGSGRVQRVTADGDVAPFGDRVGYPNSPVFDRDGNLWVSDSGAWDEVSGGLVRIAPDGSTERVAGPFRFANGLAIHGDHLYIVESQMPGVVRMPLAGGPPEPVVELARTVPDGLAFDAEGGLWIGCYQPNRIYRLDADGDLELIVDDWTGEYVMTPTNLAFAGEALDVLVLASLCGWAIKAIDPGVLGAPLHYPEPPTV